MNNNKHNHQHQDNQFLHRPPRLNEGLEAGDLERLIHNEIHVDEYKSKMGDDEEIVVISFKVGGKDPAVDLVNFIEKGYDWVIDADTSAGEMDDGDYIVFVEIQRNQKVPNQIIELLTDMIPLTGNKLSDYRFRYHKTNNDLEVTEDNLRQNIPTTPKEYAARVSKDTDELNKLKMQAGVDVKTKAPKNDYTESIRSAAGILR